MPGSDDAEILARGRLGDWSLLVGRYGPAILAALRVRMKGLKPDDLEDFTQEAWAHLLEDGGRRLESADPSRPLGPYLVTAALNLCRKRLAEQARSRASSLEALPEPEAPAASEAGEGLGEALEGLSPRDRLILTLVEVEGLTPERVARALGVSPGSVSGLASRARRRLRERFKKT